jgi:hypothetical protein
MEPHEPGSNTLSLCQAQENFAAFGASAEMWLHMVRPPTAKEQRPSGWQSINTIKAALIHRIHAAFAEVRREDGITLHEAIALDDYATAAECQQARRLDTDQHWTEIPDVWLEQFDSALCFLDAKGFRYYIPAYLIWALKHYRESRSFSIDSTIYAFLTQSNLAAHQHAKWALLNPTQAEAIASFLQFWVDYGENYVDQRAAAKALEQYWSRFKA